MFRFIESHRVFRTPFAPFLLVADKNKDTRDLKLSEFSCLEFRTSFPFKLRSLPKDDGGKGLRHAVIR
jgi:hypothetical protein